ncbi:unnamed protein product [Angiostrongylus costaricensis]|uniref:Arm-DNA-bind_5 domain-containing protein n=1 Tax=Angiostrongylus costaricensis TaxID=334426 RepID=A0A0R3PMJ0_ANGCS|nr:unnamed protein product [Angiostrongylus costaricensis]
MSKILIGQRRRTYRRYLFRCEKTARKTANETDRSKYKNAHSFEAELVEDFIDGPLTGYQILLVALNGSLDGCAVKC